MNFKSILYPFWVKILKSVDFRYNLINIYEMTYKVTEEGNIATVYLNGEIDMDVTEKAKEVIMPLIEAKKEVHLNLKDVEYMDSSGISVLIESHQQATENETKVILKEISKSVLKVIMMAKLEQILNLD
jgi:anti-anti-sigma factor